MHHVNAIPVIDLFAGPGGLGEGFAALGRPEGRPRFDLRLSIEKDQTAHQTLELRAFFRQFPYGEAPAAYYEHLRGRLSRADLFEKHKEQADAAGKEAWCKELGVAASEAVRNGIRKALGSEDRWVLIGGPPCQAYSSAGRSRNSYKYRNKFNVRYVPEDDPRQYLYVEYLQILADHCPPVFVMENVKGLLSAKLHSQSVFDRIREDLHCPAEAIKRKGRSAATQRRCRYRVVSLVQPMLLESCDPSDFIVFAERHGIPQARHRVILLGIREGISTDGLRVLATKTAVPARQVLTGLPKLRSGLSYGEDSADAWKDEIRSALKAAWLTHLKRNGDSDIYESVVRTVEQLKVPRKDRGGEFVECDPSADLESAWFIDRRLDGACNHSTRTHMPSDLHRYLFATCYAAARDHSPRLWDFPAALLPAHANAVDALNGGNFADRFRVQLWSRPATTVTSHIAKDGHYYIHPDPGQCRSLTVREAARLQTFPDNYFFCGNRTSQYSQVGNAVPPLLAKQIAEQVVQLLGS